MDLAVFPSGELDWRGKIYPCALGESGVSFTKKEGDGSTPAGLYPLRGIYFRPDRAVLPQVNLPVVPIDPGLGWCDDSGHPAYNRPVRFCAASHENMWREDGLYDLLIVVGYNDNPAQAGKGSAIFVHIARPGLSPTKGCIALKREDLLEIIPNLDRHSRIRIGG